MAHRVLVVDDHPQIHQILVQYLNSSGYQTFEAGDAASCMAGLDRDRPDVVLLDLGLPDADGLEVLRRIRATSDVYVLAVTARSEEVDRLVGLSVGAGSSGERERRSTAPTRATTSRGLNGLVM